MEPENEIIVQLHCVGKRLTLQLPNDERQYVVGGASEESVKRLLKTIQEQSLDDVADTEDDTVFLWKMQSLDLEAPAIPAAVQSLRESAARTIGRLREDAEDRIRQYIKEQQALLQTGEKRVRGALQAFELAVMAQRSSTPSPRNKLGSSLPSDMQIPASKSLTPGRIRGEQTQAKLVPLVSGGVTWQPTSGLARAAQRAPQPATSGHLFAFDEDIQVHRRRVDTLPFMSNEPVGQSSVVHSVRSSEKRSLPRAGGTPSESPDLGSLSSSSSSEDSSDEVDFMAIAPRASHSPSHPGIPPAGVAVMGHRRRASGSNSSGFSIISERSRRGKGGGSIGLATSPPDLGSEGGGLDGAGGAGMMIGTPPAETDLTCAPGLSDEEGTNAAAVEPFEGKGAVGMPMDHTPPRSQGQDSATRSGVQLQYSSPRHRQFLQMASKPTEAQQSKAPPPVHTQRSPPVVARAADAIGISIVPGRDSATPRPTRQPAMAASMPIAIPGALGKRRTDTQRTARVPPKHHQENEPVETRPAAHTTARPIYGSLAGDTLRMPSASGPGSGSKNAMLARPAFELDGEPVAVAAADQQTTRQGTQTFADVPVIAAQPGLVHPTSSAQPVARGKVFAVSAEPSADEILSKQFDDS